MGPLINPDSICKWPKFGLKTQLVTSRLQSGCELYIYIIYEYSISLLLLFFLLLISPPVFKFRREVSGQVFQNHHDQLILYARSRRSYNCL